MAELAGLTGITKQSLSLYANGGNVPPYENVRKMAFALGFPADYFMVEDMCTAVADNTYFRSQATATKTARKAQCIKMEYVAKMYKVLLNYVSFPVLDIPNVSFDDNNNPVGADSKEMFDEIEYVTKQVRKAWKLGIEPIENFQYILESHGIIVTGLKNVDAEIDTFSQKTRLEKDIVFIVALALGEKPIERLRFDMGHELGHILLHSWDECNEDLPKELFNAREKQANMFASALLLPKDPFCRDIAPYATDIDYYKHLKKKWRVSMQAMMYRARQLDVITGNQLSYMMRQVSKNGWRKREPGDMPGCLNSTIFQGALDILFDGGYLDSHELRVEFAKYGIVLSDKDMEDLMGLEEGTLIPEPNDTAALEPEAKIIPFSIKNQQKGGEE
ncbi:MAG: XRE family transcriptional regulator [Butyrivibrio sp.]|nr:XRE family transcriptional regulator [Acetatifactor muris]MCM1558368.1 XRE family transcriptional regulator [Butyrivibrio sp.]